MRFPARPPGSVPGMEPGEDRVRSFHRHLADGTIGAVVDLLNDAGAHWYIAKIGIEFGCVFHFEISFSLYLLYVYFINFTVKGHQLKVVGGVVFFMFGSEHLVAYSSLREWQEQCYTYIAAVSKVFARFWRN